MNLDERIEALTMNLELLSHLAEAHDRQIGKLEVQIGSLSDSIAKLVDVSNRDADNIRTLARIAEADKSRVANLEG